MSDWYKADGTPMIGEPPNPHLMGRVQCPECGDLEDQGGWFLMELPESEYEEDERWLALSEAERAESPGISRWRLKLYWQAPDLPWHFPYDTPCPERRSGIPEWEIAEERFLQLRKRGWQVLTDGFWQSYSTMICRDGCIVTGAAPTLAGSYTAALELFEPAWAAYERTMGSLPFRVQPYEDVPEYLGRLPNLLNPPPGHPVKLPIPVRWKWDNGLEVHAAAEYPLELVGMDEVNCPYSAVEWFWREADELYNSVSPDQGTQVDQCALRRLFCDEEPDNG